MRSFITQKNIPLNNGLTIFNRKYQQKHYKKNITRCYSMTTKSELTPDEIHRITKITIQEAASAVIGDSEEEKKQWCVKRLTQLLETFDSFIPVVGMFLDNPLIDDLEKNAIEFLVEWGWDKFSTSSPKEEK